MCWDVCRRVEAALWGSYVWAAIVYTVTLFLLAPELVRLLIRDSFGSGWGSGSAGRWCSMQLTGRRVTGV